jgi:rod shape-determining protein MreC
MITLLGRVLHFSWMNKLFVAILSIQQTLYSWGRSFNAPISPLQGNTFASTRESLSNEEIQILMEDTQCELIKKENDTLRKQLSFLETGKMKGIVSRIIGSDDPILSKNLIVDKGFDDGIKIGQAVITDNGIIIGKIFKTEARIASVMLLTDNRSKLAVGIISEDITLGLLEGEHDMSLKMNLIPKTAKIFQGETVITSGLEKNIPRGLIAGIIGEIYDTENELFQSALVKTPLQYITSSVVTILTP